jgi:hypothetical protein
MLHKFKGMEREKKRMATPILERFVRPYDGRLQNKKPHDEIQIVEASADGKVYLVSE